MNKRDRYGRIIGKLIKDGQDINLLQIKDGFAWHYKYYEKDQSLSIECFIARLRLKLETRL